MGSLKSFDLEGAALWEFVEPCQRCFVNARRKSRKLATMANTPFLGRVRLTQYEWRKRIGMFLAALISLSIQVV